MKRTRNEFRKGGASAAQRLALALVLIVAMLLNDWASRVASRRGLKS